MREVWRGVQGLCARFGGDTRDLVADIHAYASYYCAMALGAEGDAALKQSLPRLAELKVDVAYPFLLDVYHDHKQGRLGSDEVLQVVRLVESYVFRRAICAIPDQLADKTFAGPSRSLRRTATWRKCDGSILNDAVLSAFPLNDEFQQALKVRDLYNFRSRSYWLRRRRKPWTQGTGCSGGLHH